MKNLILSIASFMLISLTANAGIKVIRFNQLPEEVQSYARTYFPAGENAYRNAYITYDDEMPEVAYTLVFTSGDGLEFRSNYELKLYECTTCQVPVGILPEAVAQTLANQYADKTILKYEVVRISQQEQIFEITFNDGIRHTFNEAGEEIENRD